MNTSDIGHSDRIPQPLSLADSVCTIAHDVNNALTVISGNLASAERHAAGNPKLIRLLNNVRLASDRAAELASRLLDLAKTSGADTSARLPKPPLQSDIAPLNILVVEDDPDVGEVAVAVLENMGHRIELRTDAASALALLRQTADFDLVFSDIMMPGPMNGIDLAEAIATAFPSLPVLLATGYSNAALAPGALRFPVLAKPYSVQDLARRVNQIIKVAKGD